MDFAWVRWAVFGEMSLSWNAEVRLWAFSEFYKKPRGESLNFQRKEVRTDG
jgi:hypothetical protein